MPSETAFDKLVYEGCKKIPKGFEIYNIYFFKQTLLYYFAFGY